MEIKDGDLVYVVTTPSIAKIAVVARVENTIHRRWHCQIDHVSLRVFDDGNARDFVVDYNQPLLRPKYLPIQGEYCEWILRYGSDGSWYLA